MKKVLSFVLVLSLVLSSVSMAFAGEVKSTGLTDIAGNANEDAIRVVNDLGIVTGYGDGTFKAEKAVNRAEFAVMLTKALGIPESAVAGFSATNFKDVAGYEWAIPYLGFCESKGIMSGYGDGNVKPGKTIDVSEAVTMVCRALGYMSEAKELVGTWPANYISLSQSLGLYEDVLAVTTVDRASAAQLVYNALNEGLVYIDEDGATRGTGATMLDNLGGVEMNAGNEFVLTSTQANTAVININKYVGAYVTAYANEDGDIIAVEEKSVFLDGKYNSADGLFETDDVDYYLAAGVVGAVTGTTNGAVVVNGETSTGAFALANGDETVIAAKVSGKTIKEIYSRADWSAIDVFEFEADMLDTEDCELNGHKFATDNNGEIDTNTFALLGVATLADIEEDDVVAVYMGANNITRIAVGQKTVTGTITKVDYNDGLYYIDGVEYELAGIDTPKLGEKGTASLTLAGDIAFWDVDKASAGNYAVLVATKSAVDKWSDEETVYSVKLFNKEGKTVTATVEDEVTADAMSIGVDTVVEYSLDKDGNLDFITTAALSGLSGKINEKETRIGTTPLAEGVIVFVKDGSDWTIGKLANFDRDEAVEGHGAQALTDDGEIVVMTVNATVYGAEASYGVINTVTGAVDTDGDKYYHAVGYLEGKELEGFTDVVYTNAAGAPFVATTTTTGIYKITVDGDGIITSAAAATLSAVNATEIGKVNTSKMEITATVSGVSGVYGLTDDVVVYIYNADKAVFELGKVANLKGCEAKLYQTDSDLDGFDIVLAW